MTALIAIGFWSHLILINYRIQAHSKGMGGEAVMLALFVPTLSLWALLGKAL